MNPANWPPHEPTALLRLLAALDGRLRRAMADPQQAARTIREWTEVTQHVPTRTADGLWDVTGAVRKFYEQQRGHHTARYSDIPRGTAMANELENYWKRGEGALRIRWGTPGDWTRCHRQLIKHVGDERARHICSQWHRDTTGVRPGDKRSPQGGGLS